ncbi:MAG: outer membrane protein OmpA-like peptidoglycan-associated protein [Arenicella sp.]|jgi:outer membrane protein OmpA-like peptidoglycan-associated protein
MLGRIVTILTYCIALNSFSQGFKMHYSNSFADCFGAVEVLDYNSESHVQFPGNYGNRDDFMSIYPDFHESNSVWLRLEPSLKGKFEFEIFTENNVDFSYFLFKADDNSFCEKLENDEVKPVLSEMSSYYDKGASDDKKDSNFKPSVDTEPEDVFYLMIHTNSTYEGKVRIKYSRIGQISRTLSEIQDFREDKAGTFIRVRIRDKERMEPVEANMIVSGLGQDNALFLGTDFIFDAAKAKDLHFESNTPGYFLFVKDVTLNKGIKDNAEILIELEKLAPGKKLLLEDIKFEQDSDEFVPIAMPALKRLLGFLAVNDEVRIDIQGHVNAPDIENNNKVQKLSEDRARAVKKFLKNNGISPERIEATGFGNTEMLFEKPNSFEEEESNRRVEILIVN